MTAGELLIIVLALSPVPDSKGRPITRNASAARDIATVCAETTVPVFCAIALDVLAARESNYRKDVAGDCPNMRAGDPACTRELGARSCGAFQTPCGETPARLTGIDQVRIAWKWLAKATRDCPDHPLWAYAVGKCVKTAIASTYETIVTAQASQVSP
jgi:hypothetical protein